MNSNSKPDLPIMDMDHLSAERAIGEFRAGRAVILDAGNESFIVMPAESLGQEAAANLATNMDAMARLVLPGPRLSHLGLNRTVAGSLSLPVIDAARIEHLVLDPDARIDAPVSALTSADEAGLELVRLSLLLPAVVVARASQEALQSPMFVHVSSRAVQTYRKAQLNDLHITGRAPVPLEGAPDTEFVVFRGGEGMRDQVAIVVSRPDFSQPVTIRLHSACLTGDLFGSLKCDCGDQLRGTTSWMAQNGGGILLYLDQEGRGNGISSKIRAYALQAKGFDTYEADAALGFGPDQRRFDFAALMLTQLGVHQVRLMTNNPQKIAGLEKAGLDVVGTVRIEGRLTDQNISYLATKRDKAGHMLDPALEAASPRQAGE